MELVLIGLNHRTATLALRERVAFSAEQARVAAQQLRARGILEETLVLSTCNRSELYGVPPESTADSAAAMELFLASFHQMRPDELGGSLYRHRDLEVVRHLYRVAAGLDSMLLGEAEILGQVREAYDAAREAGTAGPMLHPLFQRATAVAKQVMTQTTLGEGRTSVATVTVEYARRIFDVFSDKTVLSIGAGKMARLMLANMAALKPVKLLICNRDSAKAAALAKEFGGTAVAMEHLADHLAVSDIVISGTGSSEPIITRSLFEAVMRKRRYRPVFLIDIAVPRDVAGDVAKIENVYL